MDIFTSIGHVLQAVTTGFYSKIFLFICAFSTAFITPIAGLIVACLILNIADLITGINVALKQGKTLWSRKMWTGTIKKIRLESMVIVLLHVIEHFAISTITDTTVFSGGATVLICLTELWSILENLNTVNPEGPWKILKGFLKHKGEELAGVNITVTRDGKLDVKTDVSNDMD